MSEPNNRLLLPHGGYEKLRSYKVSEVVYDATVVFCDRFIEKRSRTHDQMVQAARSGVRNISEGSGAAATSRKTEIKLTNVARASLSDELAKDFKSFLIQSFILAVSPASKSGKGISGTWRIHRAAICFPHRSKKVEVFREFRKVGLV